MIEDETRICLAVFHTVNLGGPRRKHGSIVITSEGMKMRDLVAVTRLVDMARSDRGEIRGAFYRLCIRVLNITRS